MASSFVGPRPLVDGEFGDLDRGITGLACDSGDVVLMISRLLYRALEAAPPREHQF